jgi:pimeloyl-ACP methyl ester carboxylesterase
MARADVNGIEIDYQDTGRGRPIVLTHGHLSSRTAWDGQHRALADRYRVISWDTRGHGQTVSPDDPAQYSLPLTVADVRALLGHLGIERAVIGGLSLGGYISLAFALAHPEMVEALVICDSGPGYRNDQARAQWNERAFARAAELEAELTVVHGWQLPSGYDDAIVDETAVDDWRTRYLQVLHRRLVPLTETHPTVTAAVEIRHLHPADALIQAAKDSDLVVLGRGRLEHPLVSHLGSVARAVIRDAACPVEVVNDH